MLNLEKWIFKVSGEKIAITTTAVFLLVACPFGSQGTETKKAKPIVAVPASKELYRSPIDREGKGVYVVSATKCTEEGCSIEVGRLGGALSSKIVVLSSKMISPIERDEAQSAKEQTPVWTSGLEGNWVELKIRPIQIADKRNALLITQTGGFEHVHRYHRLIFDDGDSVKQIWSGDENFAGPEWSSVASYRPAKSSVEYFYRIYGFDYTSVEDKRTDSWSIEFFKFDPLQKKIVSVAANSEKLPVWIAIVGTFASIETAVKFKDRGQTDKLCLSTFQILNTNNFPKLVKNKFVVAQVSLDKKQAELMASDAHLCSSKINGYVKNAL